MLVVSAHETTRSDRSSAQPGRKGDFARSLFHRPLVRRLVKGPHLLCFLFFLLPTHSRLFWVGQVWRAMGPGTAISWGIGGEDGVFPQLDILVCHVGWPEQAQDHEGVEERLVPTRRRRGAFSPRPTPPRAQGWRCCQGCGSCPHQERPWHLPQVSKLSQHRTLR